MTKRKVWADEDIKMLKKLNTEGRSQQEIADKMGRTVGSVNVKMSKLKIKSKRSDYLYEVGQYVNVTLKIVKQIRVKDGKNTKKGYVVQSVVYPTAELYEIGEQALKDGIGCAYKAGKRVCPENSLWSVENVRGNIIDIDEAKTITKGNNRNPMLFKCATKNCDNQKVMCAQNLVRDGYSCPNCSTGTSYPERHFTSYLNQYKIEHEYQVRFDDLEGYIFDYRIVLNGISFLVETHGLQHYYTEDVGYYKVKDIQETDSIKRNYAKKNNINYIELDCRKSDFEFIKNQINSNEYLPSIKKKHEGNIMDLIKVSSKYDIQEIIRLYKVDKLSTYKIADRYNVSRSTITIILTRNSVEIRGNKRMVKCIETGEVYNSGMDVMRETGISNKAISRVCNGKAKTAGGYHWEYVD